MVPAQLPPEAEGLLATIVFFNVDPPELPCMPPPPKPGSALLPEMVELLTSSVPSWLYMPPPLALVLLPEMVELLTVALTMPPSERERKMFIPPPDRSALLSEMVELLTSSVVPPPSMYMPPPA